MKKQSIVAVLLFGIAACCHCQQVTFKAPAAFESTTVKAFADDLFLNGFLDEAAGEYRRYLFSTESIDSSAVVNLAEIYRIQKDADGIIWLGNTFADKVDAPVQFKLRVLQGKSYFSSKNIDSFSQFSSLLSEEVYSQSDTFRILVPLSLFILNHDIPGAASLLQTQASSDSNLSIVTRLCATYKKKSPVLATFLSAILPGAGRWYTGSLQGGFNSFLSIVALGSALWYTADHYGWDNWRPWVFSGLTLFSYTVELYGAARSATRYNNAYYQEIVSETEKVYDELY